MENYIKTHLIIETPFASLKVLNVITISEVDLIKLIGEKSMAHYEVNGYLCVDDDYYYKRYERYLIDVNNNNIPDGWYLGLKEAILNHRKPRIPYKGKVYQKILEKRKIQTLKLEKKDNEFRLKQKSMDKQKKQKVKSDNKNTITNIKKSYKPKLDTLNIRIDYDFKKRLVEYSKNESITITDIITNHLKNLINK